MNLFDSQTRAPGGAAAISPAEAPATALPWALALARLAFDESG